MAFHYVDPVSSGTPARYMNPANGGSPSSESVPIFMVDTSVPAVSPKTYKNPKEVDKKEKKYEAPNYVDSSVFTAPISVEEVDRVYDAMYQWGTDDEALESVLNNINKDNVMSLMLGWNKYHSSEEGESFMKAFMWDADNGQKKRYGKQIARALRAKAEELGVYQELAADFGKIDHEMRSILWINNDIYMTYDKIIARIAKAMNAENGEPKPKGN